ncbi:VacJ family lipoprotein [Thiotrichales bacterium 19S3-7]|nr:VacJ family lipoprotein [Thiotrichales bacterium 19S3-7]MCF6800915.1 VacJ family lipoprotein [Thiotrichales bacterium 19S3-11]
MHKHIINTMLLVLAMMLFSGCATKQNPDPYESMNRAIFNFNDTTYKYAIGPATDAYVYTVPGEFRNGVDNFFSNLGNVSNITNDLLQAEWYYAFVDSSRFVLNSIFGVFGLFDVAKTIGLEAHTQTFGLTLAKWGYTNSAYLVIPIIGPSTVRDTIGLVPDYLLYPLQYGSIPFPLNLATAGLYGVNQSSIYLPQYNNITEFAFDPYIATRNAYLQYMNHLIDPKGNPNKGVNLKNSEF